MFRREIAERVKQLRALLVVLRVGPGDLCCATSATRGAHDGEASRRWRRGRSHVLAEFLPGERVSRRLRGLGEVASAPTPSTRRRAILRTLPHTFAKACIEKLRAILAPTGPKAAYNWGWLLPAFAKAHRAFETFWGLYAEGLL